MYDYSKIVKATYTPNTFGNSHRGDVYIALCDSRRPLDENFAHESFFFIRRDSYEEVDGELKELHKNADHKVLSFLVDNKLMSETDHHKYLIFIRDPYYHYLVNTLLTILFIADNDPDAEFYIFTSNTGGVEWNGVYIETFKNLKFMSYLLNYHKIPHYFLKSDAGFNNHADTNWESVLVQKNVSTMGAEASGFYFLYPVYKFRNVTLVRDYSMGWGRSLGNITELFDKYIRTLDRAKTDKPEKFIYIGRGGENVVGTAFKDPKNPHLGYASNIRMFNEGKLEKYLKSKGFYIFNSDDFKNHEDQIALLSGASLIVGPTGTGLINSLFMPPGKTVVELRLEVMVDGGRQQIIPYYGDFAYAKGHKYIALDVSDKQADTAIGALNELFSLLDISKL